MITHATGLSKFLGKIRSSTVVYNAEEENYFSGRGMGVPNVLQQNMEIYDHMPTSNPSDNKVRIVSIEEVEFCTEFVGGVPVNKIYGLMKGYNGSWSKYKIHADWEKGDVESAFYLTPNITDLFLKPLVSLIIWDANHAFISQVGEYLSKDTAMDIMEKVNHTKNNPIEGVEEAVYIGTIPTVVTEVI